MFRRKPSKSEKDKEWAYFSLFEIGEPGILKLLREKMALGHTILQESSGQGRDDESGAVKSTTWN